MIVGIDPGINGAAAVIDNKGHMANVVDIPTVKVNGDRREVDAQELFEWLRWQIKPQRIVIEDGAYFKGAIDIKKEGKTKDAKSPSMSSVSESVGSV